MTVACYLKYIEFVSIGGMALSLRYLKAKRQQIFISLITWISVGGVAVGVMALIVVLAVMSGFEDVLKHKIVGTNAHVVVLQLDSHRLTDYEQVLERVRRAQHVIAVAPFVYSQVMLSSGQSVSGVVVRGVPPEMEEAVIDLKAHMTSGSLAGLGAPFEVPVEGGSDTNKDGRTDIVTPTKFGTFIFWGQNRR